MCHENFVATKAQLGIQGHDESVLLDWQWEGSHDIIQYPQSHGQVEWYNQTKVKRKLKDDQEDWHVVWPTTVWWP